MAEIFTSSDALYTTAIGAVRSAPDVRADLSTVGKIALDAAWTAFQGPIVQVAETAGLMLLSEGLSLVPPALLVDIAGIAGTISSVVGAVSELVPVLGAAIGLVGAGIAMSEAADAQIRQHSADIALALLTRPVVPSGPDVGHGPVLLPADILATDPTFVADPWPGVNTWLGPDPIAPMPYASLGITLAALTESQAVDTPSVMDSTLRHTDFFWDGAPLAYVLAGPPEEFQSRFAEYQRGLGIPRHVRHLMQALRLAIGSRNVDQGRILWPIYMDLLLTAWERGQLTSGFMNYMLSHVHGGEGFRDAAETNAGASLLAWEPYMHQIGHLLDVWLAFRNTAPKPPLMRLRITPTPRMRGLRIKRSSSSSSARTPAEQAALDAYAEALGLPPGSSY